MYKGAVASVITVCGIKSECYVAVGLHQQSTLSQYLAALIVENFKAEIQDGDSWCMLFSTDMVVTSQQERR